MATVMTQPDIDRKTRLDRLPNAIERAAGSWNDALIRRGAAVTALDLADQQHPAFVTPTAMQRMGQYMRLAVYPANYVAELTAGAATAMYIAKALLNVGDDHIWLAPVVFASIALTTEIFVAHARESGRNELGQAPAGWTAAAFVIVMVLVGLQATSQIVDALKPLVPRDPRRLVSDLEWFVWTRVGSFCALLSVLHAAVLLGGRAQENALAYAMFRSGRCIAGIRVWWHDSAQRAAMADFSKLVTAYHTHRDAHGARSLDVGPMPAFNNVTRAMLIRLAQPSAVATGDTPPARPTTAPEATSAPATASTTTSTTNAAAAPTVARPEPPETAPASGLEDENAYLRSILEARTRNEDGEVRPLAH